MNYPTNLPIKPEVTLCCHSDQVARLTVHYDVTDWMKNGVKTKKVAFSSSPINRISNESDFGFRRIPKSKIQFNHFRKLLQFKYNNAIQIQNYFILYEPCHIDNIIYDLSMETSDILHIICIIKLSLITLWESKVSPKQ